MVQDIYLILGASRSGKDTASRYLMEMVPEAQLLKFSTPVKRDYERRYGLPEGALELDAYRYARVPGTDQTFLDHLVADFDSRAGYYLEKKAQYLNGFHSAQSIVCTDCRMLEELDMLQGTFPQANLKALYLTSDRAKPQPSDRFLDGIICRLMLHDIYLYRNNGTLDELREAVRNFIENSSNTVPVLIYPS